MTRWSNAILATVFSVASLAAGATDIPLSPGQSLTGAIETASPGDTIQLAIGNYPVVPTGTYTDPNSFAITKRVKIVGMGSSPNQVRLIGGAGGNYAVKFWRYPTISNPVIPENPSGASLENLTIDSSPGGIQIYDYNPATNSRLANITIKDVVIRTASPGTDNVYGVLLKNTDNVVLDNVTVTSWGSGFIFVNTLETLLMNSTLTNTGHNYAAGLAIMGGSRNVIVNNTIGSPKADPALDSGYSFLSDSVVVYNSAENRIENNTLQGHRDSGINFQALNLAGTLPAPQDTQKSLNNYAGKNNIVSTGFAAGRDDGGGIWVNCSSDNTWLYGNEAQGGAEAGVFVWLSRNNMVLANSFHNNKKIGITVSGGSETPSFCYDPNYQVKPTSNYLHSNYVYYNRNDQVTVRNANSTEISRNFVSPRNGFGGPLQACLDTFCQSAFSLETDASDTNSNGFRVVANTSAENIRGFYNNDGKVTGLDFYFNRMITSTVRSSVSRFVTLSTLNIDFGSTLGGNFWDRHTGFGNPSASNPYAGVFQDLANNTGLVVDRYPYQSEDFGRGQSVVVFEPRLNQSAAQGTRKTVRWQAPGCTLVDVLLDGTTNLVTNTSSTGNNAPNTGYAVVTIPDSAAVGPHAVVVKCKDSAGNVNGQGSSPTFNVTSSALQLVTPGRDDVFDANQTIFVGWKKTAAVTNVNIDFSSDGGSNFTTLLSGVTGNFARVTLPNIASTAYAMIRVVSASGTDDTDGAFALRGTSGVGFTNVSAGRKFVMGQLERLEWASPQGSRLVDITATVGTLTKTVASNLPDRGNFDWVLPDMGTGPLSLAITFKQSGGTWPQTLPSTVAGSTLFPTTITFGNTPAIAPGQSQPVTATANSGLGVTFTSLTPSICTVSGTTVTAGAAAGTCIIAADQGGNSAYAAAPQVTLRFTVGQSQTISFGSAPLVVVNGTGTVSATASSGLTVSLSTTTPSVCAVLGSTVSGLAAGTCTIAANQAGNGTFSPAPQATQSFSVVVATNIPRLANISTRARVETGDNVMIGGFIVGGNAPKKVLITARGPFMAGPPYSVPGVLADPSLQLFAGATPVASNDNWQQATNSAEISLTGLAPTNQWEATILTTVNPGVPYTAIVTGVGATTGVALVEVFEADHPENPLLNISTRARVMTGDNVLIGGFIIQGSGPQQVLITARGPSLGQPPFNVPGALADPTLDLYQAGIVNPIESNDNWGASPNAAAIQATGNAPSSSLESAIIRTLQPGAYTAIVRGKNDGTGVGLVEVYAK